jgi:hypothetical protein
MKTYIYISGDKWPSFTLLQIAISHLHSWEIAISHLHSWEIAILHFHFWKRHLSQECMRWKHIFTSQETNDLHLHFCKSQFHIYTLGKSQFRIYTFEKRHYKKSEWDENIYLYFRRRMTFIYTFANRNFTFTLLENGNLHLHFWKILRKIKPRRKCF